LAERKYAIQISVESRYLSEHSKPEAGRFSFAYSIRITNVGAVPAQLISRHWIITDAEGKVIEVKGLGVVGQQPLLAPGQSFEYSSGCQLTTPVGSMHGNYFFVAEDGERFEAPIAEFGLAMPRSLH
jgi:ApaG protein